jgi:hypothetical protein
MKILIDECLPVALKGTLTAMGHECQTMRQAGYGAKKNGELLTLAEGRWDVLLTSDRNNQVPTKHDWAQCLYLDPLRKIESHERFVAAPLLCALCVLTSVLSVLNPFLSLTSGDSMTLYASDADANELHTFYREALSTPWHVATDQESKGHRTIIYRTLMRPAMRLRIPTPKWMKLK